MASSRFGESVTIDPNGNYLAVGAKDGASTDQQDGVVFVMNRLPHSLEYVDPILELHGDLHWLARFGAKVLYSDFTGTGTELVVGTGNAQPDYSNGIYRFSLSLVGEHGLEVAIASIVGGPVLGQNMAAWDGDGDNLGELVTSIQGPAVAHFPAPWTGHLTEADADVVWTDPEPNNQLSSIIEAVGDIDGDGNDDLAIGAQTHWGSLERTGAAYLVPAGSLASGPASQLAYQFLGTELGEGVGSAATSGDYDGDGNTDLVIGAYGVVPGQQTGKVLGYLGPLTPAIRYPDDADFVVHGENVYDWFGSDVVTVDSDGDARDDLVVGAQGWNGGQGKVYLLLGSALMP